MKKLLILTFIFGADYIQTGIIQLILPILKPILKFTNSEQAFMWWKAWHFGDVLTACLILQEPDPAKVKKLGRQVKNFDADMDEICL